MMRSMLLKDEGTCVYLQRDSVIIGAVAGVSPHLTSGVVDMVYRRPVCWLEIAIEVYD